MRISIIGPGYSACALAAQLYTRGAEVMMFGMPEHPGLLDRIEQDGYLETFGEIETRFRPKITKIFDEALRFSKFILIMARMRGHHQIRMMLEKYDLRHHILIVLPGGDFSSEPSTINAQYVCETSTGPFACRPDNRDVERKKIPVKGIKLAFEIAGVPEVETTLRHEIRTIFTARLEWLNETRTISRYNLNGILHPVGVALNAGWIEATHGDFQFMGSGISPSVVKVIEALDVERSRNPGGPDTPNYLTIVNKWYGTSYATLLEYFQAKDRHNRTRTTPATIDDPFMTDDVEYVLGHWYEADRSHQQQSENMLCIIRLCSILSGREFIELARGWAGRITGQA